jgi:hypothetical protein
VSPCGLWRTPRRLLAVVLDEHDRPRPPISVALTHDARWGLVVWLQSKGCRDVVLTDLLARGDPIARIAVTSGVRLWMLPAQVVEGVRQATELTKRPPKHTAALLARWPSAPALRPYLRAAEPDVSDLQLALW